MHVGWVTPTILVAAPQRASASLPPTSLSLPPGQPAEAPVVPPTQPLAFTGDDILKDVELGTALIASGWVLVSWAATRQPPPPPDEGSLS